MKAADEKSLVWFVRERWLKHFLFTPSRLIDEPIQKILNFCKGSSKENFVDWL